MAGPEFRSVDEYIASQPENVRPILAQVRNVIREAVPGMEEGISYKIPAYKQQGRGVLYFAGWKKHFSLYPVSDRILAAIGVEAGKYEVSKGTVRFPLADPVPVELIGTIARYRAAEVAGQTPKTRARSPRAPRLAEDV